VSASNYCPYQVQQNNCPHQVQYNYCTAPLSSSIHLLPPPLSIKFNTTPPLSGPIQLLRPHQVQ
jgi:hypothetical protein